jgi:polysaccharide export outer membrane protein
MQKYIIILVIAAMFQSCDTWRKVVYFQDFPNQSVEDITPTAGIVIQPKDMLSIVVSSKNPELVLPFNLPVVSYQAGSEIFSGSGYANQRLLGYVVDNAGAIDFPILGKLPVAGLTRWQLAALIKGKLQDSGNGDALVKDPVVTVEFMNFRIHVAGEVNAPGTYQIEGDRVTILEALSRAKDLTIYGRRDNVAVIREKDNATTVYRLDLRSKNMFHSPAFYLQQNDYVYVEPNKVRVGQSTLNQNTFKSTGFWMSLSSLALTLVVLFR